METYEKFGDGIKIIRTDEQIVTLNTLKEEKAHLERQVLMLSAEIKDIETKINLVSLQ